MYTREEVLEFVEQEDVHFIRLAFFDLFGKQKNVSILPNRLERAFEKGVAIDSSLIDGFENDRSMDLFLYPDPSTMTILPWRSSNGNVIFMICDIRYPDGKPFELDTRWLFRQSIHKARSFGIEPLIASKYQFYLLEEHGNGWIPNDQGSYLDVSPLDRAENIRRDICLILEEMGCPPYKSFHQRGPGQNEIDFHFTDALKAADEACIFKWVTRTISHSNNLRASFAAMPVPGAPSNGLQVQLKFFDEDPVLFDHFLAGILNRAPELLAFFYPYEDSLARFQDPLAEDILRYSRKDRHAFVRIPSRSDSMLELRNIDARINPYLVFFLILEAGLAGIENREVLPEEEKSLFKISDSLKELRDLSARARWLCQLLPARLLERLLGDE